MGAALIAKPALNRNISVITFGIAQVAMDIEPGIGMLTGADVLHGPTHTILGALVIGYLVMLIAPKICGFLLRRWNKEVNHHKLPWLVQGETTSKTAIAVGAFFGTLSHVALDSLMHHDIHPLQPFSQANPLNGLISHDGVYQVCAIAGVIGAVVWLVMQWLGPYAQVSVGSVSPEALAATAPQSVWRLWIVELRSAWFWLLFMSIIPSYLFSSGLLPLALLAFAILLMAPATALGRLFGKGPNAKDLRQLAIMVLVPLLSVMYVLKSDDQITANAAPIVAAIESFRVENGQYPDTLVALAPKHLVKIPELNYLFIQPRVTYRMTDGEPYLRISAAAGGFAHFEYDFAAKVWNYYS
jgi:membrane-bound metal-dependent hydrolase YbcI (DUF457 family)